ncbi:M23 family metallopeptidase [Nocardioides sp. NPDC126508]
MPKTVTAANDLNALVTTPLARGTYNDLHNFGAASRHWARWHTGTDLSAPCGTPVLAATAGMVIVETGGGWSGRWLVKVTTGTGKVTTWYGHMRGITVEGRQIVRAGQQIGYVGSEGNSTGCHLHFEVHANGGGMYQDNVDPSLWLAHYVGRDPARKVAQPTRSAQPKVPGAYAVPQGAVGDRRATAEPIGLGSLLVGGGESG